MTLIEILVVLAVLGLMVNLAGSSLNGVGQAEISRSTNQLAATVRFAFDRARFTGDHYRILLNFEERSFKLQAASERMYLPATDRNGELLEIDEDRLEEREERDERAAEQYYSSIAGRLNGGPDGDDDELNPYAAQRKAVPRRRPPMFDNFQEENTLSGLGDAIVFPEGVKIVSFRTDSDFAPITSGEASLYFFPQGRTQLAHIQLSDEEGENKYTVIVQPLTGKVEVVSELVDLELPGRIGDKEDDQGNKHERRVF